MRVFALLPLLALPALAQEGVTRGNALRKPEYQTGSDLTLYVDPAGRDTNACTGSGTNACATLTGAWNKLPRFIQYNVTINVDGGTYADDAVLAEREVVSQPDGGLPTVSITGPALANVTPTTGSATGSLTAVTAAGGNTEASATLADSTQSWTTDDLVGRRLVLTSGPASGTSRLIVANTATTVRVFPSYATLPAVGNTYSIQDTVATLPTLMVRGVGGVSSSTTGHVLSVSRLSFTHATKAPCTLWTSLVALSDVNCVASGGSATGLTIQHPSFLRVAGPVYVRTNTGAGFSEVSGGPGRLTSFASSGLFFYSTAATGTLAVIRTGWAGGLALAARRTTAAGVTAAALIQLRTMQPAQSEVSTANGLLLMSVNDTVCAQVAGTMFLPPIEAEGCTTTGVALGAPFSTVSNGIFAEWPTNVSFSQLACSGMTTCLLLQRGARANLRTAATGVTTYSVDGTSYTEATFSALSPTRIVGPALSVLER